MREDIKKALDNCGIINISSVNKVMNTMSYIDYNEYMEKLYDIYTYCVFKKHYVVINPIAQRVLDIIDKVDDKILIGKGYNIIVTFGALNGLPEKAVEYALKFEEIMENEKESSFYVPIYSSLVAVFYKNKFYKEGVEYLEKLFGLKVFDDLPNSIKASQYLNYLSMKNHIENKKMYKSVMKELDYILENDKSDEVQSMNTLRKLILLHQRNEKATIEHNEEELQKVMFDFEQIKTLVDVKDERLVESQDLYIDILKTFYDHERYQYVIKQCQMLLGRQEADYDDLIALYHLMIESIEKLSGDVGVKIVKAYNEILSRYYETQIFLKQQMIEKSVEFHHLQKQVESIIRLDPLTGCFNRRYIDAYSKEKESNNALKAVLFCDFDNFKKINDNYGHRIGDAILIAFSDSCSIYMKDEAALFRVGGDEFVIISSFRTRKENEEFIALVKRRMLELCMKNNYSEDFDFSYGIIMTDETPEKDINVLINMADEAMYANKSIKKNR